MRSAIRIGGLLTVAVTAALVMLPGPATATFPGPNGIIVFRAGDVIQTVVPGNPSSQKVIYSALPAYNPTWSPDGKMIVLTTSNGDGTYNITVIDSNGHVLSTPVKNVTSPPNYPAWSPDGTTIAYGCPAPPDAVNPYGFSVICAVNVTNGAEKQITQPSQDYALDGSISWSPDGQSIVYTATHLVATPPGQTGPYYQDDIAKVPAAGGTSTLLTSDLYGDAINPDYSPDGKHIAFYRAGSPDGAPTGIVVMSAGGGGGTSIVPSSNLCCGRVYPRWSPDGTRMLFETSIWDGQAVPPAGNDALFSVNAADGSNAQQLTNDPNADYEASWGRSVGTGGLPNPQPDLMIGFSPTSVVGKGIYNTTGAGQTKTATLEPGATKTFFIVLQNAGDVADDITLQGPGSRAGFTLRYFAGSKNVTQAMEAGGLVCESSVCKPGKGLTIRLIIAVSNGARAGSGNSALITAISGNNSNKRDAVLATVHVTS